MATEPNDITEGGSVGVTETQVGDDITVPPSQTRASTFRCAGLLAYGLLPALVLVLALAAGYLKWQDASARDGQAFSVESVHAATQGTIALLSYRPDTVEKDLGAARDLLTGSFRDSYTALTHDVVIPASKEKKISAVATVAAAASVSVTENHAVVLVFVDQALNVADGPPTGNASSIRVTLDRVHGRWLIAGFDPI